MVIFSVMVKCVSIRITGRVQHVGFRFFATQEADKRGVSGFVRNEADGSVYIEAQANEEFLDDYIVALHRGPAWSRVHKVDIASLPLGDYQNFSVRY